MDELHGYAERRMRAAIRRVPEGRYQASDVVEELEGEAEIRATVTVRGDGVQVDFEGTAEQRPGNLNCPLSVTRSAVYYVVRVVCAPDLEASGGAFVPVQVRGAGGMPGERAVPGGGGGGEHGDVEQDRGRGDGGVRRRRCRFRQWARGR